MEVEMDAIAKKYGVITKPIIQKSMDLIAGRHVPSEDQIEKIKGHLTGEELAKVKETLTNNPISEYWYKVITNCQQLSQDVFEPDHDVLKHLKEIKHFTEEGTENFSLEFHFAPNEFFENEVLKVRFAMISENDVEKIVGCAIKWKEGKDTTKKTVTKK